MFPMTQINLTAGATGILPARFLQPYTAGTANFRLCQLATATGVASAGGLPLLGVSELGTTNPIYNDGYVAELGDPVPYRGPLQIASLQLGGTVSAFGVPLTNDPSGQGVTAAFATGQFIGAIALDQGVSGDIIEVYVLPPFAVSA